MHGSTGSSPPWQRWARGPRRSACWRAARFASTASCGRRAIVSPAGRSLELEPEARDLRARARGSLPPRYLGGRAPARGRQACRAGRPSVRGARLGNARARSARSRGRGRGGARAAGHRPPARSRHLRAPGGGEVGRGASEAAGSAAHPQARPRVPGARTRPTALAARPYRGPDRPRPPRSDPPLARHGQAARRGHALRGTRAPARSRAPRGAARDRPHAPDQSSPRCNRPARLR